MNLTKSPARLVLLTSLWFCLTTLAGRASQSSLFERVWGNCVVVTDMTDAGRNLTPPTREKPVYYLGELLGSRLGWMPGDRLPDQKELGRLLASVLAQQDLLPAQPGVHEPELFLVVQWGRLTPRSGDSLWFLGYNPRQDPAAAMFVGKILGPEVHRRDFRPRAIETVLDYANDDLYGIIISAFEYKSVQTTNPLVFWQTRIGLPANGKGMREALALMTRVAGPQIGRETTTPVLRSVDHRYETELGELEFLGFEEEKNKTEPGQ